MSDFDTSKWFKQQYLTEANLTEEKLSYIPPDAFYAIYNILKSEVPEIQSEYGTASYFGMQMREKLDMYGPGEEILMGLKEAPESTLNLSKADMDKLHKDGKLEIDGHKLVFKTQESIDEAESTDIERLDFAFVDGTTQFYGAYIYNKGSKTWDKKLRSSKEVQDFLSSLGINIEFKYNNLPEIFKALKAQGIKAEDSEFDVS